MDREKSSRTSPQGTVSFLLHAHLPYGIRPDLETSLEQAWLFEAVTGCYLPLFKMLDSLPTRKGAPWLTLSLSPTLLELWAHPEFAERYHKHLNAGRSLIEHEAANPKHSPERRQRALQIKKDWDAAAALFATLGEALTEGFRQLAKEGKIELITTAATHALLPAFQNNAQLRQLQIENGIRSFVRHTGIRPKGFWLPECAYFPGLETELEAYGIEYFCLEARGLQAASPPASVDEPLCCPNGLLALGRDSGLSQRVWSARSGYPGHPNYREFHCDGIHQVDSATCGPFALPDGGRLPFGLKYWRVTGRAEKAWYDAPAGAVQAGRDAEDFVQQIRNTQGGLTLLPFDAELFGHWWYEGPQWLEAVLQALDSEASIEVCSAACAASAFPKPLKGQPAASTWGRKSDYSFWINRDTDWIYPLINAASERFAKLVQEPKPKSALHQRALEQAGRELLLASASDWPFMIRAGSTVDYAVQRVRGHIGRFHFIAQSIEDDRVEAKQLERLETLNPAFSELCFQSYA